MHRGIQLIGIIVLALIIGAGVVLFRYGTISPCGVVRVQVREQAARSGGAQGFITGAISDNLLDTLLASRYGPLTPGRCLSLALSREPIAIGPPER